MPDEIVTIRIDFEANRRDMARVLAEIEGFEEAADGASEASERFTDTTRRMNRTVRQVDEPMAAMKKRFADLEQSGKRFGKQMTAGNKLMTLFKKSARLLFFQLIALVAEFVITAATLASVNLMFKLGQWAVKGYNLALGAAGAALATVAVAASTAVAAFKEFNAAAAAWQYKGANVYGSATGAAAAAMRGLYSDTNLATMGVTNLTQAYKTMSQQGRVTGAQTKALSGAMDFTARSQDQNKSFQAMANFVAILQKEGKVTGAATSAAANVSKEFADAIKKSKGKDAQSIMAAMSSGKLAQQAGVSGEFGSIKGTLVAQFKQITVALAQDMADFGEQFLNDTRRVLDGLFKNVRNVFARLAPEFAFFGKNKLFPAITTIGNALEKFSVTLVRKYLPMLYGASEWFKKTSASFMKSFNQFKNSLEKFREGSRIITETFKGPLMAIFRVFGRNAESLGYLAQDNEEQFKAWGGALENLVLAIGDWFAALKVAFTEALPVLTAIVNVLSKLISGMASLVRGIGTFKLGGGEGFMGLGGTGGGPSGTVGGGLGSGIGSLVTLGLLFGGFKGSRTAYRMRRGGGGNVGDLMNQSSAYAARSVRTGIFGGIPAMFDPKRYSRDRGNMRLTPAEVAANMAYSNMMMSSGRSYHDPGTLRDMSVVRGAEMMGLGNDKQVFANNGFERTGFANIGSFRSYYANDPSRATGSVLSSTIQGQRMNQIPALANAAVRAAHPDFDTYSAARQQKLLTAQMDDMSAQQMRNMNMGRDLMYGRSSIREFFGGGVVKAVDPTTGATQTATRESIFKTLSGKRMKAQIEEAQRINNMAMGGAGPATQPSELAVAREKALAEFRKRDAETQRKFVDEKGNALSARKERAMYRAFAREQFKARTGAMFKGVGESAQASMRKTFNPMMGMMGGMLLSTGITNKIGDQDMRSAANNALGIGAMFGARGMGIAAGITLMKSTSTGKSAMGGALAGAAVGKTISDALGPMLGPAGPLAKAAIIGGSALIGGIAGALRAQGNREREARKIGEKIGERMIGRSVAAMVGATVDPKTGRLVQSTSGTSYARGLSAQRRQNETIASFGLGEYGQNMRMRDSFRSNQVGYNVYEEKLSGNRSTILAGLRDSGLMTKDEITKMEEYLRQASGGNSEAAKSFDEMVAGFQGDALGYTLDKAGQKVMNVQARTAEDFFATGRDGQRIRGQVYLPKEGLGREEVFNLMMSRGNFVTQHLAKITGMTEKELMQLASKMDVDLHDPTKSLTELMGDLGKATRKTVEEMKVAIRDIGTASLNIFDEEIKARAETQAFTASKEKLMGLGSTATIDDFRDYARLLVATTQRDNPDNPFAVLSATRDFAAGNLGAFGSMSQYGGLGTAFASQGQAQAQQMYDQQLSQISGLGMQQILGGMAEQGFVFQNVGAADRLKGLMNQIFGNDQYSDQEKTNLLNFVSTGQLLDKSGNLNLQKLTDVGGAGAALASLVSDPRNADFFATETSKVYEIAGEVGFDDDAKKFFTEISNSIKAAFDAKQEPWEGDAPSWWSDMKKYQWKAEGNVLKLVEGDTRTSRRGRVGDTRTSRALRGTMAAHAKFNSLLTGKRTITSALRFDNLGSMSSDHAAGRAYDLTGDNLGQYQQMISKAGGFAEFHGWGSSRHLHVVPPIGGTNTPRAVAGVGGTMNQTVTLNVYGAPGQSETAIARQVVMALEQQQRAYRERS